MDLVPETMEVGDTLRATLPNGRTEGRTINGIDAATGVVTVSAPWSSIPVPQSVWATESSDLVLQLFRVIAVTEGEELTYNI
ncbi:hypothetical protein, partial [Escherichia coli]|uniref:hypothetical protein n=1 Tax=Escherichia coli TaxID=562 RepID=UPI003B9DE243